MGKHGTIRGVTSSLLASMAILAMLLAGCATTPSNPSAITTSATGIHKIKHIIIIFQENRSFDTYFGTYPGADGIPMQNGVPTVCVPDPRINKCVKPYVDHNDVNGGGPHEATASQADIDGGKMDGFIKEAEQGKRGCSDPTNPVCSNGARIDVMGYHVQSDIPNYWSYAQHFVLQDHMYEAVHSWSFPSHLFLVSAWSADCRSAQNPLSCTSALMPKNRTAKDPTPFAWTDITYLLDRQHVSWVNYLDQGANPLDDVNFKGNGSVVPKIWNVLPGFSDVHQDNQLSSIQTLNNFFTAAKTGTLPAVSWILAVWRMLCKFPDSERGSGEFPQTVRYCLDFPQSQR